MEKIKLLTGSHFRKNKATSIGLFLLMILAAMLISSSLLLFTDVYPTVEREAKRLNAGNGFFRFTEDLTGLDDAYVGNVVGSHGVEFDPQLIHIVILVMRFQN